MSAHQAPLADAVRAKRGSISGLVAGHGRPLRGVCAVAIPLRGGARPSEAIVRTGKSGKYRITKLRPGRYDVAFVAGFPPQCPNRGNWLTQFYPDVNSLFGSNKVKAVRVRAGKDTGGIDGHLKKGGEISGRVRATSGKPLQGICANVTTVIQGKNFIAIVDYGMTTDKAGRYAARGLYPGKYQVVAVTGRRGAYTLTTLMPGWYKIEFSSGCGGSRFPTQWWHNAGSARSATVISVGFATITGIDATLRR